MTTLQAEIYAMQKEDLQEVFKLMAKFYEEDEGYAFVPERQGKSLEGLLENPTYGYAWTFQVNRQIVGYMVVTLMYSIEFGGQTAFLDELYVKEGMRGKGIGSAALNFLFARCEELGIRLIELEVSKENIRAQKLYARHNFREGWRILMRRWNRR
jgi:ribosomal protein S18 acetylase RimI-like enzyme